MRLHLLACAFLGLSLTATSATAADQWRRLQTEHFTVIGDTGGDELRNVGRTLERFRTVITQALPTAAVLSGETVIILFKDDHAFTPYKPEMRGADRLGGLFTSSQDAAFIALNAADLSWALQSALTGYSRFMVGTTNGRVPPWVSTGIGDFYRTFQERNGGRIAILGAPDSAHVNTLRGATLLPLDQLFKADLNAPNLQLGSREFDRFTAESWALVHYLTLGNKDRTTQFRTYIRELRGPRASDAAKAFGDLSQLEQELRSYVAHFSFPAVQLTFDEQPVKPGLGMIENLSADESDAYLAGFLATAGNVAAARDTLEKVLKRSPAAQRASLVLGLVELRSNNADRGIALLEQAAASAPADAFVQSSLGRALAFNSGSDPEKRERARTLLSHAVQLGDGSALTLATLGYLTLSPPADAARAVDLLKRAVDLDPLREDYRLWLANGFLLTRDFDGAKRLLGPLMATSPNPAVRDTARAMLARISDLQATGDQAGAPRPAAAASTTEPPH